MQRSIWPPSSVKVSRRARYVILGWLGLTASLLVTLLLALPARSQEQLPVLVGKVIKIVDGDTIDVRLDSGPIRVRFHAIDTPERGQPWFKESTDALSALIANKQVQIEPFEQDRYERLVGIVFLGELNVNAELVKRGHAWAFRKYMRKVDASLCEEEAAARAAKRGLWALTADQRIAPWEWRRRKSIDAFTDYSTETASHCVAAIGRKD
jgi:micrococcal nuclease